MPKKSIAIPDEAHDSFSKANTLHRYVTNSFNDAAKYALECGEELIAAKAATPHGSWEEVVQQRFDGSLRAAQFYMAFYRNVSALPKAQATALLITEGSLEGASKAAKDALKPKANDKPNQHLPQRPETPPVSDTTDEPETEPADDPLDFPDGPDPDIEDYGKCPNCAGDKWETDDDGAYCKKCNHPHGEPAGDVDEDRVTTQRQKTVKTLEAASRAFDDLHLLVARPAEHKQADKCCKELLRMARAWK